MKTYELVKFLEDDCEQWEALTGEILAILTVNIQRDLLRAGDPTKFAKFISLWNERRSQLQASRADHGNVGFNGCRTNAG